MNIDIASIGGMVSGALAGCITFFNILKVHRAKKRRLSGDISTSDADRLWDEASKIRHEDRDELLLLRKEFNLLKKSYLRLIEEMAEIKAENKQLREHILLQAGISNGKDQY